MNFQGIINNFIKNLHVVETYVNGVEDMIYEKQKKIQPEELESENIKDIFKTIEILNKEDEGAVQKRIEELNNRLLDCTVEMTNNGNGKRNFSITTTKNSPISKDLLKSLEHISITSNQVKMIFESSLISLAVYFELLVTSLIQERLKEFPQAMNIEKKSLTISEIEDLGSFEEAKIYLIEREVVSLMHSGFKDWLTYFKTNMKIPLKRIEYLLEEVNEVFNRRNLFVHGGGIVNSIYLKKVHIDIRKDVKKGDKLEVDDQYILKTINNLRDFGTILALEVWKSIEKDSEARPGFVNNLIVDLLFEGNWTLIKLLCDFLIKEKNIPASLKWQSTINYWLSMKKLGYFDEVVDEVKSADFSVFSTDFRLCQLAILDDFENFFYLLESEPNAIKIEDLKNWPVFENVRQQEKYKELFPTETYELELDLDENDLEENERETKKSAFL